MKILFYVQRIDDAHLAEALAADLKDFLGVTECSALCFRNAPEADYLKKIPTFKHVLSETQMHEKADASFAEVSTQTLERIEADYGLPFWHYVSNNRFLIMKRANYVFSYGTKYSRDELLRHVVTRFEMTERFLDEVKPDLIIYSSVDVGPSSALILEKVAKARGIPLIVPISVKMGHYHAFTNTIYSELPQVEDRFHALNSGAKADKSKATEVIQTFREGNLTLPYVENVKVESFERTVEPKKAVKRLSTIMDRRVKAGGHFHTKHKDAFNLSQLEYDFFRATIEYRKWRMKLEGFFEQPKDEPFVFFPLHVEPELALLLYAPYQMHQDTVIRNVSQSLGATRSLYVKEHPQGIGKKSLRFYRSIKETPNVRFVAPDLNSRSLMVKSEGVVTITGTAAMEAMLLGKPAVTLGDVFFNFAEGLVTRAEKYEDLPELTKQFSSFKPDEEKLVNLVIALLEHSVEVDPESLARSLMPLSLEQKQAEPTFRHYADFLKAHIEGLFRVPEAAPEEMVSS